MRSFNERKAEPELSARISQRNPDRINGDVDVKPVTQSEVNPRAFNPKNYIKPSYIASRQRHFSVGGTDVKLPPIEVESRNGATSDLLTIKVERAKKLQN